MRLLTFETPTGINAVFFTNKAERIQEIYKIFPVLAGCKFKLDLQVDVSSDEIVQDTLYIPLSEATDKLVGPTEPILAEFKTIGESLIRQRELELKTEKLMEEIYNKAEQKSTEPLPLEE